ncbi:cold shock domain-containing protein [Saccharopolyspora shandongensis]|uniref:cold shock domain-containing protein n=1 Tax=Saccharopolyspora shandongensis TaxID=418495 RepID=UPI0033FB02FD
MESGVEYNGHVEIWHVNDGWGVISVQGQSSKIWGHYSHIEASGFRSLAVGDRVKIKAEPAEQDGYHWRATWIKKEP